MNSFRSLALLIAVVIIPPLHAQRTKEENKPLLYNDITDGSTALNRDSEKAYAGKFRVIKTTPTDGFFPAGVKGFQRPIQDPRSMRDYAIPSKIAFAFIVTPDGRVIEPRILHSTDERFSKYIINRITYERYFPARFRGAPVYSLHGDEIDFGGQEAGPRQNIDGLGVYHSRDR
ncbi:MAG: hypothetical protein ABI923_14025 [bacterium]